MFLSMNWIGDFVDLSGLDKKALIKNFTLSTAEVEDNLLLQAISLIVRYIVRVSVEARHRCAMIKALD